MRKVLLTDLDGTILKGGELSFQNSNSLDDFKSKGGEVVVSTGKGLLRVNDYFLQKANQMILENGNKIYDGGNITEKIIDKETIPQVTQLLEKLHDDIEFLFFYDSNNANQACFYVNERHGISDKYKEKFKGIMNPKNIFKLEDLIGGIISGKHKIGLLNIKTKQYSFEELGINSNIEGLNLVFNEGMLNVGVASKGDAVNQIITPVRDSIDSILVAGNDKNDLPMFDEVIRQMQGTKTKVGILIVGGLIEQEAKKYNEINGVECIHIETPDNLHLGINQFFN